MKQIKVGDFIRIRKMKDEPSYEGRIGEVEFIDDENQIHGTWGGCALIPGVDRFDVISKDRYELYKKCIETNTRISGIDFLINYYREGFRWTEKECCNHIINLFKNGTIDEIKVLGKDEKEI